MVLLLIIQNNVGEKLHQLSLDIQKGPILLYDDRLLSPLTLRLIYLFVVSPFSLVDECNDVLSVTSGFIISNQVRKLRPNIS